MKSGSNVVRGAVKMLVCQSCDSKIPLFAFDSETDVDAVGLCSATQCNDLRVAIAEVTLDEWMQMASGALTHLPSRLIHDSEIKDFRVLHIKRIERGPAPPAGLSFSEFRKLYKPPVVIYACPWCDAGDAVESQEFPVSEFEAMGGEIIAVGHLTVAR